MTRSRESADQSVATSPTYIQDMTPESADCIKRAKCDWGKPERTGEKPTWYRTLFHCGDRSSPDIGVPDTGRSNRPTMWLAPDGADRNTLHERIFDGPAEERRRDTILTISSCNPSRTPVDTKVQ